MYSVQNVHTNNTCPRALTNHKSMCLDSTLARLMSILVDFRRTLYRIFRLNGKIDTNCILSVETGYQTVCTKQFTKQLN